MNRYLVRVIVNLAAGTGVVAAVPFATLPLATLALATSPVATSTLAAAPLATAVSLPPEREPRVAQALQTQPPAPEPQRDSTPLTTDPAQLSPDRGRPQDQATTAADVAEASSRVAETGPSHSGSAASDLFKDDDKDKGNGKDRDARAKKRERWETPLPPVGMMP